jgi:hypothetical protein
MRLAEAEQKTATHLTSTKDEPLLTRHMKFINMLVRDHVCLLLKCSTLCNLGRKDVRGMYILLSATPLLL